MSEPIRFPNARRSGRPLLLAVVLLACLGVATAQEDEEEEGNRPKDPVAASLAYRKALHHDPSLGPPLQQMLKLFRSVGRTDGLLAIYRQHLQSYPNDAKARAVYYRILRETGRVEAEGFLRRSIAACPGDAYLGYLHAQTLHADGKDGDRKKLLEAIRRQTEIGKRAAWIRELLGWCAQAGARKTIAEALTIWRELPLETRQNLELLELLARYGLWQEVEELAQAIEPDEAEDQVSREMFLARAENGQGRTAAAARRLDALLAKVDQRYWRRSEILALRFGLIDTEDAIAEAIAERREAAERSPGNAQYWLDLAQIQNAFNRSDSALETLRRARAELPDSRLVEEALLAQFERLRRYEDLATWLREEVAEHPGRTDLRRRQVRLLYMLEKDDAQDALAGFLDRLDPETRLQQRIALARRLRPLGLVDEAVALLEGILREHPSRFDLLREMLEMQFQHNPRKVIVYLDRKNLGRKAPIEQALDLGRWLTAKGFLPQARLLLESRLADHAYNPDLNVLLADIYRRLGETDKRNERLAVLSADLTSIADYRRWVRARIAGLSQKARDASLLAELKRTEKGNENVTRFAMDQAVLDMLGTSTSVEEELIGWIRHRITVCTAEEAIPFKRQLLEHLENDRESFDDRQRLFEELAAAEPERRETYIIKGLLLQLSREEGQRFYENLEANRKRLAAIRIENIDDEDLLKDLENICTRLGDTARLERIVAKLLALNPDDRLLWQRYLDGLLHAGREQRFQTAVRRALAAHEDLELSEERRDYLRRALLFSLWRSAARILTRGDRLHEALPILNQAEDLGDPAAQPWILWTRLVVLHRLGRQEALAQTRGQLERLADQVRRDEGEDVAPAIFFPDGMRCNLDRVLDLLDEEPADGTPDDDAGVPLPPYELAWATEVDAAVVGIDLVGERCLIRTLDSLLQLDRTSGKRRGLEERPLRTRGGSDLHVFPDQRMVVVEDGDVVCRDAERRVVWRTPLGEGARPQIATTTDRVVAMDSRSGGVWAMDARSGKLLWADADPLPVPAEDAQSATPPVRPGYPCPPVGCYPQPQQQEQPLCGWLSVTDGMVLVAHHRGRILDLRSGEVLWDFVEQTEPAAPIRLRKYSFLPGLFPTTSPGGGGAYAGPYSGGGYGGGPYRGGGYGGWQPQSQVQIYNTMQPGGGNGRYQPSFYRLVMQSDLRSWFQNWQEIRLLLNGHYLIRQQGDQLECRNLLLPLLRSTMSQGRLVGGDLGAPLVWHEDHLLPLLPDERAAVPCRAEAVVACGRTVLAANRTGVTVYGMKDLQPIAHGVWPEAAVELLPEPTEEVEEGEVQVADQQGGFGPFAPGYGGTRMVAYPSSGMVCSPGWGGPGWGPGYRQPQYEQAAARSEVPTELRLLTVPGADCLFVIQGTTVLCLREGGDGG